MCVCVCVCVCVCASHKIQKRIYDHKSDLIKGNANCAIVRYNLETNHNFKDFKVLVYIPNIDIARLLNLASYMNPTLLYKDLGSFFYSYPYFVKSVLNCYEIPYLK